MTDGTLYDLSNYFPNWTLAKTHWLKAEQVSGGLAGWRFDLFGTRAPAAFDVSNVDPVSLQPTEARDHYLWSTDAVLSLGAEGPGVRIAVHPPLTNYARLMRRSDLPLRRSTATTQSVANYLGTFGQGPNGLIPVYYPGGQSHITVNTSAEWKDPGDGGPPFFYGRSDMFVHTLPATWTFTWFEEFYLSDAVPLGDAGESAAPGVRRFIHTNIINGVPVVFTDMRFRWEPL